MSKIEIAKLVLVLKQSIECFYKNDFYLLDHSVHEQDIAHRIAYYFEIIARASATISNNLSVDVEYNRNGMDKKVLCTGCQDSKYGSCHLLPETTFSYDFCRPDIIVHERSLNSNNWLVIEIKANATDYEHRDKFKLIAFTCTRSEYKYHLGCYLQLTKSSAIINFFKKGIKISYSTMQKMEGGLFLSS